MIRLKGLVWSHRRGYAPLIATAKAYHALHPDVYVDWQVMSFHDCYHSSRREAGSGVHETDLVCFDYPNSGDYAANEWAVPIDELLSSEEAAELAADADPASYRSYLVDGRLWGFPIDSATIITAYRPDLLGDDASAIPGDWDSFLEIAQAFHKPPERYGFCNQFGSRPGRLFATGRYCCRAWAHAVRGRSRRTRSGQGTARASDRQRGPQTQYPPKYADGSRSWIWLHAQR